MRCELRQTNIRYKQNQHLKNECPTTSEEEQEGYQGAEAKMEAAVAITSTQAKHLQV